MSELIAEARVLVTPDTTGFRSLLIAEVTAATKGVVVPVQVTPVITGTSGVANAQALAGAQSAVAANTRKVTDELKGADAARKASAAGEIAQARRLSGLSSGAASAGLSMVGLRGATLAATGPFLAGAAAAIGFGKALQTAASFNSEIAVLGATTGATAEQLAFASQSAREFGRDISLPGVTAGDAAKTITEFAKAGLELNDAVAATRGGLQLAQAAQLSYADAVTLTANALNAFNLEGDEAVHVADVLANAANLAQGGIGDTALALRQAAGAAAVVGVSFEDTAALLTLLAKNGLTGSDAGTALRTAFLRLVNPSKEAQKILEGLNVELRDINGNVRPQVFADFAAAQQGLAKSTQQANAAIVFGQDAFRAFGFLGREGATGLAEVRRGLDQTGTASRIANARMVGLTGATANLTNQLDTLGLVVGQTLEPVVAGFINQIAEIVSLTTTGAESVKTFGENLAEAFESLPGAGADSFVLDRVKDIVEFSPSTPLGIKNIVNEIKDVFGDSEQAVEEGGDQLRSSILTAIQKGEQATFGFSRITQSIRTQMADAAAALTLDLSVAQARGNEGQELSLLRTREQRQENFLNAVLEREGTPKNVALATEAAQNLDDTRAQIDAILDAQTSAAKANADRITQKAREADQAFLAGLAAARENQENAVASALNTESVQDDIRENTQLRTLIVRQIAQIRAATLDQGVKTAAIQALTAARIATTGAIKRLIEAQREEREANRQAIFDRREENADLRIQIAEARGNKDAVIQLLDARIRIAQQAVARAKKAKEGILAAILELEELKKKRRELLNAAEEDEAGGTTAFQLLTDAAQRFGTAGNLIGTNQPFAGPTEFTADLSQFLRRNAVTTSTATAGTARQDISGFQGGVDRLVTALNANTNALNGGEAGPTVRKGKRPPVSGAIERNDRRWLDSKQARDTIEGAGG